MGATILLPLRDRPHATSELPSTSDLSLYLFKEPKMPDDKRKGTGEPNWTEEEKSRGAPTSGNAGTAGEAGDAVPKAGYGGDERAATEAAAAQVEEDSNGKAKPDDRKG